ncbi:uncharacterized protein TNCV_216591 [Trichonephila clavipes]|nr:uncharacterized protein TNCV_216591 [Trichonephila clavipes]
MPRMAFWSSSTVLEIVSGMLAEKAPWSGSSRRDQSALIRFFSGHLMSLTFVDGMKHFKICTKCSSAQASPGHILSCLGLTRQDLIQDPLWVLDFFRVNGLMDLI